MKRFTKLPGAWTYRVRLRDGTFAVVDGSARWFNTHEAFRVPEAEIKILREKFRPLHFEKRDLTLRADGKPRVKIGKKSAERVAEIDRLTEEGQPLSIEYAAFGERVREIKDAAKIIEEWKEQSEGMAKERALMSSMGFQNGQLVDYQRTKCDTTRPGRIFIQRRAYRPCLSIRLLNEPSGLFGISVDKYTLAFPIGTAPASEPTVEEILSPLVGKPVAHNGGHYVFGLMVSVRGEYAEIARPLKTRGKFSKTTDRYYIHHPEAWTLAE